MATVAIYSADPILRRDLEQLLLRQSAMTIVGIADDAGSLARLIKETNVSVVVADAPSREHLGDWRDAAHRAAFVVMVNDTNTSEALNALHAGAHAVLPRSANDAEIAAAIEAASRRLAILPRGLLDRLLDPGTPPANAENTCA